jgi:branched-chain amino acid transport system substrate-binding protein
MKLYLRTLSLGLLLLAIISWLAYKNYPVSDAKDSIHIAFVGPLSGSLASEGAFLVKAVQLYLDNVNSKKGVGGKQIVLDKYDDQNDAKIAPVRAKEIAESNAVAVIGHYYSGASVAGGQVYKQYGIPAITPSATGVDLTQTNEWYFRTVFNDELQGRFLANYIKKVLLKDSVVVIQHNGSYGKSLAKVFQNTAQDLGMTVKQYSFDAFSKGTSSEKLEPSLNQIQAAVNEIKVQNPDTFIFLAMFANEGVEVVRALKDSNLKNPIMVPAAFASGFVDQFDGLAKEKMSQGYYADDIYISSQLIFDTANSQAQKFKEDYHKKYNETADVRAAFAYDAAILLVKAIEEKNIQGKLSTLQEDRQKIRDYLASLRDIKDAIEGTTGFNYFDDHGNAQKPVVIGQFKGRNVISALTQLQPLRNFNEISSLETAVKDGSVLEIDNRYMYKTNVVYVGIKINEISELDIKNLSYMFDFNLWFRFSEDISPENIQFYNAIDAIQLKSKHEEYGNSSTATQSSNNYANNQPNTPPDPPADANKDSKDTEVKTRYVSSLKPNIFFPTVELTDKMSYRLYAIKGRFKIDFKPNAIDFTQHLLGVSFRHRNLTRNNLIFVTDLLGMGFAEKDKQLEELRKSQKFSSDWIISNLYFYQEVGKEYSLGNPKYLNATDGKVDYSQFNMSIFLANNKFSIRRTLSTTLADDILLFSAIVTTILTLGFNSRILRYFPKLLWFLYATFSVLLLLSSEVSLLNLLQQNVSNNKYLELVIQVFDILWWVVPSILLQLLIDLFVWTPIEQRTNRKIPRIGRKFISFSIYLMTSFAIMGFVYDQKLTSLLATSGVIAMIVGLAIQINISNIFSGIAINIEQPFRVGDWISIGTFEEGKVIDITWRSTRIMSRAGSILSIPNSLASESPIHNFDYPDDSFWLRFTVHIHPSHPPQRVQKIIKDAVLSSHVVQKVPEPYVIFRGVNEWSAGYLVYCSVRDYTWKLIHEEAVWLRIWTHLNRAGITPAIQQQDVYLFKGVKERGEEVATKPIIVLEEVEIFRPLSREAKVYLSERMTTHHLSLGSIVVRQGDQGSSLFIIVEGVVGVKVQGKENSESVEVARLGAGNFFGEMALLTGEERTATVTAITDVFLFEITKEDVAGLIQTQPEVSEMITKILAQRQLMNKSQMNAQRDVKMEEEALYKRFREKVESFFTPGNRHHHKN